MGGRAAEAPAHENWNGIAELASVGIRDPHARTAIGRIPRGGHELNYARVDRKETRYYPHNIMSQDSMIVPDLESLRCFDAVATHANFRTAASSVSLSPSALGQRIAGLERELGFRLFERTTRRVALTPAGSRVLPLARRLLAEARGFRAAIRDPHMPVPYELTLATRFELGLSWITPALSRLSAQHPERTLHLSFGDSPDMITRVERGAVDCAVTSSRVIPTGSSYEVLHAEEYVFVASAALAKRRPLKAPQEAHDHVLLEIGRDLPLFRYFLDACGDDGPWSFARVEYLGTIGAIRLRVLEGAGVAVLPRYFVGPDLAARALVKLMPRVEPRSDAFRLLWRADHPRESELRELAAELRAIPLR